LNENRFQNLKELRKNAISVEFFFRECQERFKLKTVTTNPINPDLKIINKEVFRPGLALAGYFDIFTYDRVQVFGNTEINYLYNLGVEDRLKALKKYFAFNIPCIIVTGDNQTPEELIQLAEEKNISIFRSEYPTNRISFLVSDFLDDQFAPQVVIHGSFVDVYGIGLLFCGNSGIGKSEIALDLVERGHRLVADDIVIVSKKAENVLIGSGTSLVQHFMEIRGMGIIDVRRIFGVRAIRFQKRVEVIVELENWDRERAYDRTGLNSKTTNILGLDIETINLPIFPGKNITVIAEVIALNYLCKHYGYNAAQVFEKKLSDRIKDNLSERKKNEANNQFDRLIEYFEHDFE